MTNICWLCVTMFSLIVGSRISPRMLIKTKTPKVIDVEIVKKVVPYKLPPPSGEQQDVIDKVKEGYNVIVDSCAGSGKTTTVLHLAKAMSEQNLLLLTYNSRLKQETRERVLTLNLTNLECHSYHAMCQKYYSKEPVTNDQIMRKAINNHAKTSAKNLPMYDVIVVDEAQDMIHLYHKLIHKILYDSYLLHGCRPQLLVIGDEHQELYSFAGADFRYLTMADSIYPFVQTAWKPKSLQTSYRITGNMATFINKCILGDGTRLPIRAVKAAGPPVDYYVGNAYDSVYKVANYIIEKLEDGSLQTSDIFILAPSIKASERKIMNNTTIKEEKKMRPIQLLENLFVKANYTCYLPASDDSELREQLVVDKIVFSSFHQSKGLERKLVVVFDCSNSYFIYNAKQLDINKCPTALYVAVTRCLDKMIIIGEESPGNHLPFMNREAVEELSMGKNPIVKIFKPNGWENVYQSNSSAVEKTIIIPESVRVAQLVAYTSDKVESKVSSNLRSNWEKLSPSTKKLGQVIPKVVNKKRTKSESTENVADINGIAIPAMLEYKLKGSSTILRELSESILSETNGTIDRSIVKQFENLQKQIPQSVASMFATEGRDYLTANHVTIDHFLELATLFQSAATISDKKAYLNRIDQIKRYDWITENDAKDAIARMEKAFFGDDITKKQAAKTIEFEKILRTTVNVSVPVPAGREPTSVTEQRIADGGERDVRNGTTDIVGRIDVETNDTLWEIKCVSKLTDEHKNQLLVYAWIYLRNKINGTSNKTFKILNVLDNECWELKADTEEQRKGINSAVKALLRHHFGGESMRVDDEEFVLTSREQVQPFALVHPSDNDTPDTDDNNKGRSGGRSEPSKTPSTNGIPKTTASMSANTKPKSKRISESKPRKKWEKKMTDTTLPLKKEKGIRRVEETIKCIEPLYVKSLANCDEEQRREKKEKWEYMMLKLKSLARSTDKI